MTLHIERRDRVAILTLDDAERRNALTDPLVADIVASMGALEADDSVGAVVITGAPPAFCAGADLANLTSLSSGGNQDPEGVREIYEGFLRVHSSSLPTIAAVNGPAVGAGFNLALACDLRLVSPRARFDSRFVQIGLHPGGGHTWLLERAVGPQAAAAMVLFGERIDGETAVTRGLAWACVAEDGLVDAAVALADRAARAPVDLVAAAKASLREAPFAETFEHHLRAELDRQVWSFRQGYLKI
ncbi:MAG TPA: enoyl-CoA hydratase-related protein [Acidimicrobiia bacterium]|nr:enoyl-CoA hydratase-related protein [Acidimicrobiia bacterium]